MLCKVFVIIVFTEIVCVLSEWIVVESTVGKKSHLDKQSEWSAFPRIKRSTHRTDENVTYWTTNDYPTLPKGKISCAGNRTFLGNVERVCDPDSILSDEQALALEENLARFYTDRFNITFCLCPYLDLQRCRGYFVFSPLVALAKNIAHNFDIAYEKVIHSFANDYDSVTRAGETNQFCGNTITLFISLFDRELAFVYGKRFFQVIDGYYERLYRVKMVHTLESKGEVFKAVNDYFDDLYKTIVEFDFERALKIPHQTWFNN